MPGTNSRYDRLASGESGSGTVLAANRLVLLAAVPLFLVLAAVAYLTIQFAINEREAQHWVRHTYEVVGQINRIMSDAQDAETGQRGFLLTRKPEFLAPYRAARSRIGADLAAFRDLTHDNPSEQARARRLEALVHDRFSAFDATLASSGGGEALVTALTQGKAR